MFDFDDKDNDLKREAEELHENDSFGDRLRLGEQIDRRIECLEIERNFCEYSDPLTYPLTYYELVYRISKLEQLRDNLYK